MFGRITQTFGDQFGSMIIAYVLMGLTISAISVCSTMAFHLVGPGAFWQIGFVPFLNSGVLNLFDSLLRFVTWPYGVYLLALEPDYFFQWLFHIWYY